MISPRKSVKSVKAANMPADALNLQESLAKRVREAGAVDTTTTTDALSAAAEADARQQQRIVVADQEERGHGCAAAHSIAS